MFISGIYCIHIFKVIYGVIHISRETKYKTDINRHKTSLKTRQIRIVRKLDTYDLS